MRHLSLAAVLATLGCSVNVSVDDGEATSGTGPEAGEGGAGSSSSNASSSNTSSSGTGGSAPVCDAGCLALDFARQFDNVEPYALAVDADGNILVTGGFDGTVDFGGGPLVGTGNIDAFVLKLDPVGNHLWSRRFGDLSSVIEAQVGLAIATDASGNIAIGGRFGGTTDLGGGPVTNEGDSSGFVVVLDASGQHVWSKHFGAVSVAVRSVGFHPAGGVVVAGDYGRTMDLGGGPLADATAALKAFAARLDASGGHLWSRSFGGPGGASAETLTMDAAGNTTLGGSFHDVIDFGGGPLHVAGPSGENGPADIFVASLDPDGEHRWSQRLGGVDGDDHLATVMDGAGGVVTLGSFFTTFSVGDTTLTGDGNSVSVSRLSASGSAMFARSSARAQALATDAAGNTWLAGTYLDGTDLGCGPLTTQLVGMFVAGLDPSGDDFCNVAFEPSEYGGLTHIALGPNGALVAVGKLKGTIDFGAGPISSPGEKESMIVVKLTR
ncbi:hypothetical protein WMF11_19275 [Sorangium sp. So ce295]|uniref:hypothetical protein n=1 Tax=Sorangium sp. So ce295 TaxID=3133295 RepID=UPI003F629710